jgi:CheY-like chemotaxis protein
VRCLLAEDNPVNQRLFLAMLDRAGIQASLARNGLEAVKLACDEQFDLAIMDVQMPEMDGLEAAGAIRRWEAEHGGHIPIIAITAHAMPGDRDLCFAAGMDSYLSKPVRMEVLLDEIHTLLSQVPPSVTMGGAATPQNKPMSTIDYAQALDRVGGDRELLGELAALFLDEYPRLLGECNAGIENVDHSAVAGAAHQLKGLLAQFGSEQGRQTALALENAAKAADDAAVRSAFHTLSLCLNGLRPVFTRLAAGEEIS